MRYFVLVIALLMAGPAFAQGTISGVPSDIDDGDTFTVNGTKIRMFGMDTPEKAQQCENAAGTCYACGKEAGDALKAMIEGQTVVCDLTGATTYDRKVAVCKQGSTNLSVEMVRLGWAVPYWRYHSDRPALEDDFETAFTEAAADGLGLHQGRFIIPAKWRRGDRLACE